MNDTRVAPSRIQGVEEAPLQGELMLYDPKTGRFFVLNRTMAFVWSRCDGTRSVSDIAGELLVAFAGVDAARGQADVDQALAELRTQGLIADP
jgi:hypothetical protein